MTEDEYIEALVDSAPLLEPGQLARLRRLLASFPLDDHGFGVESVNTNRTA